MLNKKIIELGGKMKIMRDFELKMQKQAMSLLDSVAQIKNINEMPNAIAKFNNMHIKIDVQFEIQVAESKIVLNIEVRNDTSPNAVRDIKLKMIILGTQAANSYGILMGPFFSETAINICRENGFGCIDQAGNAFINVGGIYIHKTGFKNKQYVERPLSNLFSLKETRVPLVLLANPGSRLTYKKISEIANISIGSCSNAIKKMREKSILKDDTKHIQIQNIDKLVDLWAGISRKPNIATCYYPKKHNEIIVEKINDYLNRKNIAHAFTTTAAVSLIYRSVKVTEVDVYIDNTLDEQEFISYLKLSTTPDKDMLQINIIEPSDYYVLWNTQTNYNVTICSDFQIFLDLIREGNPQSTALAKRIKKRIEKA